MYFLFEVLLDLPTAESLPAKHRGGGDRLCYSGPVLSQPPTSPAHQTQQFVADISPWKDHSSQPQ